MESPSFNQHNSSNGIADIADRVVQQLHIDKPFNNDEDIFSFMEENNPANSCTDEIANEKEEEQEFEFPLFCVDSESLEASNVNVMYDELISPKYPLFDQTLLQDIDINSSNNVVTSENKLSQTPVPALALAPAPASAPAPGDSTLAPASDLALAPASTLAQTSDPTAPGSTSGRLSLMKLLIEARNNSASTSSSDADDLELLSPESYCVWNPKKMETTPRGKHKKSNSISLGIGNTSKKWNVRHVFKRSYSDDNYTVNTSPVVLFLPPVLPKVKKNNEKVTTTKREKNPKVGGNNKPEDKLPPAYKGKIGNIRLPAYLPYRQDQIGKMSKTNNRSFD
ncbi:hypothetical protein CTI12_AA365810 [Artemisia annua]|uniref:Uncharacterized protein n=1 Tax=Artemisia annua TaxID=35608 RepID=A0A2U1MLV7_ARTAN|nr:hypothetical protein CTI12_AA365810 [Artemisia annua]